MLYMIGFHRMDLYRQRLCYQGSWQQPCLILFDSPAEPESSPEVLIVFNTGLISKYFSKGVKYCLNSDMLSSKNVFGRGYLHRHLLLNNWLNLED